jgi:hypothetical protein
VPITDLPLVVSPSVLDITLGATVTATAAQLLAAEVLINTAMTNYIQSVGINGTIRIASIIELVMEVVGVVDISNVTINGGTTNLTLGSTVAFVVPSLQPLAFGYIGQ